VAAAGARIIGGCCGNSPAHLRAMAAALGRERGLGD
jgi:methionine synthase I (cobalamin-dependent)